jgi:hypothetical protein
MLRRLFYGTIHTTRMVYCVHYHFTDLQVTKGIKLLKVGEEKEKKKLYV